MNQLEGLSVTAFRGISAIISTNELQNVVAGILGAEAYYDGAVRWRLSDRLAVVTPWQQPLWRIVNAFSALRVKLSGSSQQASGQASQQQSSQQVSGQQQQQVSGQQQSGQQQMGQQQQSGKLVDLGILQPVAQSSLAQAPNPRTFAGGNAVQIAAVDPNTGLVFSRSPQQVLGVLYGTGDASQPGLFFPQGITGNVNNIKACSGANC